MHVRVVCLTKTVDNDSRHMLALKNRASAEEGGWLLHDSNLVGNSQHAVYDAEEVILCIVYTRCSIQSTFLKEQYPWCILQQTVGQPPLAFGSGCVHLVVGKLQLANTSLLLMFDSG